MIGGLLWAVKKITPVFKQLESIGKPTEQSHDDTMEVSWRRCLVFFPLHASKPRRSRQDCLRILSVTASGDMLAADSSLFQTNGGFNDARDMNLPRKKKENDRRPVPGNPRAWLSGVL